MCALTACTQTPTSTTTITTATITTISSSSITIGKCKRLNFNETKQRHITKDTLFVVTGLYTTVIITKERYNVKDILIALKETNLYLILLLVLIMGLLTGNELSQKFDKIVKQICKEKRNASITLNLEHSYLNIDVRRVAVFLLFHNKHLRINFDKCCHCLIAVMETYIYVQKWKSHKMKKLENYKMITYSAVSLIFILQSSKILATEISALTTTTEESNKADVSDLNNVTFSLPIAEKLIYVHHPASLKSIKHIIQPIRQKYKRVKRPKIKYSFAEPPGNYHNDHGSPYFGDFSPLNAESDDFGLPTLTYDTHVTDVKFYNDYDKPKIKYEEMQKLPPYSYGGSHESKKQVYKSSPHNYKIPEDSYSPHPTKTPSYNYAPAKQPSMDDSYQVKYSPPAEHGCNDYDNKRPKKIITYAKPIYISASLPYTEKPSLTYGSHNTEPSRIPATKYGVPDVYLTPSTHNSNSYFDQHAQPPQEHEANVQVTYSHANDIKFTSPSHYQTDHNNYEELPKTYEAPSKTYDYSPPYRAPSLNYELPHTYQTFTNGYNHPPPHNNEHSDEYQEPSQGYDLSSVHYVPSQNYHHSSGYETTSQNYDHSSSYEEPSQNHGHSSSESYENHPLSQNYEQPSVYETSSQNYDHAPSHQEPSQNHDHSFSESYDHHSPSQNYEHPPSHQKSSHSHQPSHYEPPPQQSNHIAADDYIPPSNELPISRDRKQPLYEYPKSSYEVPIYDAVPFDAVNDQEHEIYPPHASSDNNQIMTEPNSSSEEPLQAYDDESNINNDSHSASSITTLSGSSGPRRVHKKQRGNLKNSSTSFTAPTRHILDVPELKNAFENEKRLIFSPTDNYVNPSVRVENLHVGVWNPMKIRTSSMKSTSPPSTTVSVSVPNTRVRNIFYRGRTTAATTDNPITPSNTNVEIVSINKSHSKAYYDGILSTPKFTNANVYRKLMNRHRSGSTASTTMQDSLIDGGKLSKRTTKSMLDTTPFKSPYNNDMDIKRTLPKNHKLF
uniref:Uncharacterized protein n=1 Tax=Glossina brevipalpis TaxID=37001 RepID=A0A1A9WLJ6_9MUSC